jgi:TolA-binding protein
MRKQVIASVAIIAVALSGMNILADESQVKQLNEPTEKIKALEERVLKLEQTTGKDEKNQTPQSSPDLRERVKKRFEQDQKTYSQEELKEIERLYQIANKEWNSPEAKVCLKALIEKYPKANRTGCALQYLGQMASGEEKEKYLKQAIKDFSGCYYGSGVQVGAYARLYLADYYQKAGKKDEASSLYEEIRKNYPDAVNHKGKLLKDIIPK